MRVGRTDQLAAERQQALDIGARRREAAWLRLDDVVEPQRQPAVRRKRAERRRIVEIRVEDRQHMRDSGGAMRVELGDAADRQPERRVVGAGGGHSG